jgi:hypothetical protein
LTFHAYKNDCGYNQISHMHQLPQDTSQFIFTGVVIEVISLYAFQLYLLHMDRCVYINQ